MTDKKRGSEKTTKKPNLPGPAIGDRLPRSKAGDLITDIARAAGKGITAAKRGVVIVEDIRQLFSDQVKQGDVFLLVTTRDGQEQARLCRLAGEKRILVGIDTADLPAMSGYGAQFEKIFDYLMIQARAQAFDFKRREMRKDEIIIDFSDLVKRGYYDRAEDARAGFADVMKKLSLISYDISRILHTGEELKGVEEVDLRRRLFARGFSETDESSRPITAAYTFREDGKAVVYINTALITEFPGFFEKTTDLPRFAARLDIGAYRLLKFIESAATEAKNRHRLAADHFFDIPLQQAAEKMKLPSTTRKTKEKILEPIRAAVDQVNLYAKAEAKETGLPCQIRGVIEPNGEDLPRKILTFGYIRIWFAAESLRAITQNAEDVSVKLPATGR